MGNAPIYHRQSPNSHYLFGAFYFYTMSQHSEPVGNTCPLIDRCIKTLNQQSNELSWAIERINGLDDGANSETISAIMDMLEDVTRNIAIEDELEELRSANSALRKWGNDLVSKIGDLEYEISQF